MAEALLSDKICALFGVFIESGDRSVLLGVTFAELVLNDLRWMELLLVKIGRIFRELLRRLSREELAELVFDVALCRLVGELLDWLGLLADVWFGDRDVVW